LNIAVDLNGERIWSRMDSYQPADNTDKTQIVSSTGNEYIFPLKSGGLAFVGDEAGGFSFGVFNPNGEACTEDMNQVLGQDRSHSKPEGEGGEEGEEGEELA
jgi:hypothetical protein